MLSPTTDLDLRSVWLSLSVSNRIFLLYFFGVSIYTLSLSLYVLFHLHSLNKQPANENASTAPSFIGNVFESDLPAGKIWTFVNYADGFALHNPEMSDVTSLFWKQLDWIQPESFVADGGAFMTFVSRNESIFVATCNALKDLADTS